MHRNKSVDVHRFAMTPRAEIPRSAFNIQKAHKCTFDSGYLVPIYVDEVLPGDTFNLRLTAFARLSTPIFPLMDNLYLDTFFFFVPNRLVWRNWVRFMGEQLSPGDSTDYVIPQMVSPPGGYGVGGLADHMGLPAFGQVAAGATYTHSSLWFRAYNLIYNEWFRDENLQTPVWMDRTSDGPDLYANFNMMRRGKRHDYFTSCLPWPQKGPSVTLPLGDEAPVFSKPGNQYVVSAVPPHGQALGPLSAYTDQGLLVDSTSGVYINPGNTMFADLSEATATTINQLRQSFQIQKLLERDARGGTRYTELVRSHFGVNSPDARLQRPEYLGGGSTPIILNPIAQTSATQADGTPLGTLSAMGTSLASGHGFTSSFVEHGMVIGLAMVRADLTYQQGLRKMWSRRTKFDYYWPAFGNLGEQAVLSKEIFLDGTAGDELVFGYQERWAEYRYQPSHLAGLFRSTSAGTLDAWHLAQRFMVRPTLSSDFIEEVPPLPRVLAVGSAANGQQIIMDGFFEIRAVRPMPLYSVPGLIDHL